MLEIVKYQSIPYDESAGPVTSGKNGIEFGLNCHAFLHQMLLDYGQVLPISYRSYEIDLCIDDIVIPVWREPYMKFDILLMKPNTSKYPDNRSLHVGIVSHYDEDGEPVIYHFTKYNKLGPAIWKLNEFENHEYTLVGVRRINPDYQPILDNSDTMEV